MPLTYSEVPHSNPKSLTHAGPQTLKGASERPAWVSQRGPGGEVPGIWDQNQCILEKARAFQKRSVGLSERVW